MRQVGIVAARSCRAGGPVCALALALAAMACGGATPPGGRPSVGGGPGDSGSTGGEAEAGAAVPAGGAEGTATGAGGAAEAGGAGGSGEWACTLGPITASDIPPPDAIPRHGVVHELIGDRFVMMGEGSDGELGGGLLFDLTERRWLAVSTEGCPVVEPLRRTSVATIDGTRVSSRTVDEAILVYRAVGTENWSLEGGIFDVRNNSWRTLNTDGAPADRGYGLLEAMGRNGLVAGGRLFVWGRRVIDGDPGADYADSHWFDPAENRWGALGSAGALGVRVGAVTTGVGRKVFVWGGYRSGRDAAGGHTREMLADGAVYDPATDAWSPVAVGGAPTARAAAVALVAGDRVLVLGGVAEIAGQWLNDGAAYDVDAGIWRPIPAPPVPSLPRSDQSSWTGGRLLAVREDVSSGTERCTAVVLDPETLTWAEVADPDPGSRSACGQRFLVGGNRVLFFDPPGADTPIAPLRLLDLETRSWCFGRFPLTPYFAPTPGAVRTTFGLAFASGNRLFLFGRIDVLPPPGCPPGAPCIPGVPPRVWGGAVVLEWGEPGVARPTRPDPGLSSAGVARAGEGTRTKEISTGWCGCPA